MAERKVVIKTKDEVTKVIEDVTNNFKKVETLLKQNATLMGKVLKNGIECVEPSSSKGE